MTTPNTLYSPWASSRIDTRLQIFQPSTPLCTFVPQKDLHFLVEKKLLPQHFFQWRSQYYNLLYSVHSLDFYPKLKTHPSNFNLFCQVFTTNLVLQLNSYANFIKNGSILLTIPFHRSLSQHMIVSSQLKISINKSTLLSLFLILLIFCTKFN